MPIYDHNGNVLSEVSKIYDDNGSVLSQIGKVYDNNGTTNSLIYTAEQIIINGGDQETAITGGWVAGNNPNGSYKNGSVSSAGVVCASTSNTCVTLWTNTLINLSNFSKMTVDVTVSNSWHDSTVNDGRGFGVIANASKSYTYDNTYTQDRNINWKTNYQWARYFTRYTGTDGTTHDEIANGVKHFVVDISSWVGSQYIGLIAASSGLNTLTATFTKILLE